MKKIFCVLAAAAMMVSCGGQKSEQASGLELMNRENFQTTVDGKKVDLYTLTNGTITMQVTNFGARVVSLWTPDREGKMADIVLGYENIDRYVNNTGERFLGAVVGRVANRIGAGKFTLDGKEYNTPLNNNGQTLHGGLKGVDMVVWDVAQVTENAIVLHLLLPDGTDGFPGNLDITMTYTLTPENEFEVTYNATTDKKTIVNLSHHSFFNLKGEAGGTITDHILTIKADAITPVDANLIPTGELMPVEGTPFDFREPHAIGERIEADHEQLKNGKGYDLNWVIAREDNGQVETVATLYEPTSGRCMDVATDQVAIQFYSGNFFDGTYNGKYGKPLKFRESVALETQKHPDAINHDNFPSTILNPGEEYKQVCVYKFYTK
ncbi:MAG: galactose mutarotase [Rikenellaceae bacterium]|nr:galactose mutarotase [Rikenellaceae bacterium]